MKRILLLFILIVFTCSLASASVVIEAEGSGRTLEEAKENARISLAQKVFSGTYYEKTEISEYDDSQTSSELFSEYSSYAIVGEFPGFGYNIDSADKNGYLVSTKITGDSATLNYYSQRQKESKMNVDEFYSRYLSIAEDLSASVRREALEKVIIYYYCYNMYSNILLRLGGELACTVDIDTTFEVLIEDYSSLIIEENNELAPLCIIADAENRTGTVPSEKLSDFVLAEAEVQAELYRSLVLEKSVSAVLEKRTAFTNTENISASGIVRLNSYIDAVKLLNTDLVELAEGYDTLVAEQQTLIAKAFDKEVEAVRNRAYRIVELDSDGNVASFAREAREKEIADLEKQKEQETEDAVEMIRDALGPAIQEKYNLLSSILTEMKSEEFSISSETEDITLTDISNYNGADYCWYFKVSAKSLAYISQKLTLYYADVTGVKIPTNENALAAFMGTDESSEYNVNVLKYSSLLRNGSYSVEIRFSSEISLEDKRLIIIPNTVVISFSDGALVEISLENGKKILRDIEMDSPGYLSYSWLEGYDRPEKKQTDEKSKVETFDFVNYWTTSSGYHISSGLSAGKALIKEETNYGLWFDFGINFYLGNFYVSGVLGVECGVAEFGYVCLDSFFGIGFKSSGGSLAVGCNFSFGNLGTLIFPYATYYISPSTNGKVGIMAGLYINERSGRISFILGVDSENLFQFFSGR